MADPEQRWKRIGKLGEGGQGVVHKVLDRDRFDLDRIFRTIRSRINPMLAEEEQWPQFESFREAILDFHRMEDASNHGALKELHQPEAARDPERAAARIVREIEAMSRIRHPNLLRVLDSDPESQWFVSEYHPEGTLSDTSRYQGDFVRAVWAFRGLVDGVAELHRGRIVHRDIKPQNAFIAKSGTLVLGDFGIVFFEDDQHTQLSGTFENVGSRHYMPAWAEARRIDTINPSFDVFSLGKLLWSMVDGRGRILVNWYFNRPEFDLQREFPEAPFIELLNPFLEKCVVENEEDCLFDDAGSLLVEVDKLISMIESGSELRGSSPGGHGCKVCGLGVYETVDDAKTIGLNPWFDAFICNSCCNIELFRHWDVSDPENWDRGQGTITGAMGGHVLYRQNLPRNCSVEFLATLVQRGGSDEIDLIFGGKMILFFNRGVRVDTWPGREPGGDSVTGQGPTTDRTYRIRVDRNGEHCRYLIDGGEILEFATSQGEEAQDRFGFGVFGNRVEFSEIRLDGEPVE